jgi:transcriptional regulator with XRE-family HTH domain
MQDINRLKLVLVEQKKTSKWLSEELGVNPSTVSKWCTNSSQPDIETLARISKLLNVKVDELFNKKFLEEC